MEFIKYPKVKTLFKLIPSDEHGRRWDATNGEILPETAPLHFISLDELVFTEKINGTNMGIRIIDGKIIFVQKKANICDREDKGDQFYFELADKIADKIKALKIEKITSIDDDGNISYPLKNIMIYGELCGVKIQNGGGYFPERHFIVFDIYSVDNNKFFTWDAVKHFCDLLKLDIVPEINYNKQSLDVDNVKDFILNQMSVYNDEFKAEGMVVRYRKDTSPIKRWIAKIRRKDFCK